MRQEKDCHLTSAKYLFVLQAHMVFQMQHDFKNDRLF